MVNNKLFENRPITELMSIVRNDLKKLDEEGLIDEGTLIKTIMYCNERLGIPIREIKQKCLKIVDNKTKLPIDFEKLYYIGAIVVSNTIVHNMRDAFDNNFDRDVIYEAEIDRGTFGNVDSYAVTINRISNVSVHNISTITTLDVNTSVKNLCHISCPNLRKKGKYTIDIQDGHIVTPFRSGEIYIMYLANMSDENGKLLFPFHPMITPYYEWMLKEKILMDAVFNSDGNYADLLTLAQRERAKAWLDAFDMTVSKGYGEYVDLQRKKEMSWYSQYFRYFQ